MAADFENDERFILFLFNAVVKGSIYQNTSMAVPAGMHVRRVWVMEKSPDRDGKDICAIDCECPFSPRRFWPFRDQIPFSGKS
jgi:hypothetical protein